MNQENDGKVIEMRPRALPDDELMRSAAKLLRVGAAAFGEYATPWECAELSDVREVVRTAIQRVDKWLDGPQDIDRSDVYEALDVLTLIDAVLEADLSPRNRKTICPLSGAMKVAAARLEEVVLTK